MVVVMGPSSSGAALLLLFVLLIGFAGSAPSFEIEVAEEHIEQLLSRPIYTEEMRNTIRQRIREGRWKEAPAVTDGGRSKRALSTRSALSPQLVNATVLSSTMVANRTMLLREDMVNQALGAWITLWRMSDTAELYFNRVIGLNNMAYNLSLSAALTYDTFDSIPWVARFRDELVCNLNFRQPDQDVYESDRWAFAFPNYCVQNVSSTHFANDTLYGLQQTMLAQNEELLLNNDLNQISLSCASAAAGGSSTYKWYCWMYLVQLSDELTTDRCLCSAQSCCPTSLGVV